MRKKFFILFSIFILTVTSAMPITNAREYAFPTEMKVTIERGNQPLIKSGSNVVYPILNYFSLRMPVENVEYTLYGDDGEELTLAAAGERYLISQQIALGDQVTFSVSGSAPKPIRTVLSGPIPIGHIHFASGSAKLSRTAKEVLRQVAAQMREIDLVGAYLVGQTDRAGSTSANLTLSERRVNAAAKFLSNLLLANEVIDAEIMVEAMGEYLAAGVDGSGDEFARKVTILLYPAS